MLDMLFEELIINGFSKKEGCELFGISMRTLSRWNENPPQWAIRIIRDLGKKPPFPGEWYGWRFDNDFIIDDNNNRYHINDVRNIWITNQLTDNLRGKKSNIRSLKTHLENKIKAMEATINISLKNGDETIKNWDIAL